MDLWKYVRSAVYLAIIRIVIYILAPLSMKTYSTQKIIYK